MRIALVAPLIVAVPPRAYGGTERVIANLANALVDLGHEVTLFASGDSHTKAELEAFVPRALTFERSGGDAAAFHVALLAHVYEQAERFDVIHSHLDYLTLPHAAHAATPTVITLHNRLDLPGQRRVMRSYPQANYVSISDNQRTAVQGVHWAATVYHGVEVARFPFSPDPGSYLVFVGRMDPEKGPDRAIRIAKAANVPLKIAAKVDPAERRYFREVVEPLLDDPLIEFLGQVNERKRNELVKNALALLLPITWPEPFGMVFIEALACGTPVLTCPRGAAPELLKDGVTGYMRETDEELTEAVGQVGTIDRAGCRAWVEERFSSRRMSEDYVRVYESAQPGR
jgi:glycosyltransferase involved in cell wall biosynthesis